MSDATASVVAARAPALGTALNAEQTAAVMHGDAPLLVVAGAGTGKTFTLAARVARLVMDGADPQRLLLLTFSRRAADEMIRRVQRIAAKVSPRHARLAQGGFAPALALLKSRFIVASFTLLTTRLVIEVSRRNGFVWDAILSCEMIGHYKTRPEAYDTAARWLQLDPSEILIRHFT